MSEIHQQDIDGCNYTMSVLEGQIRISNWNHTKGEYDRYDMNWTGITDANIEITINDENKDRRWEWKNGTRDYDKPQFFSSFSSQMFNYEKYEQQMAIYEASGIQQCYTAGYQDGVWLCDLSTLPKDKIYADWKITHWIKEKTMDGNSVKKKQDRFLIPNEYGTFFKKK